MSVYDKHFQGTQIEVADYKMMVSYILQLMGETIQITPPPLLIITLLMK